MLARAVGQEISFEELRVITKLGNVKLHRLADLLAERGLVDVTPTGVRLLTEDFPPDAVSLECEESRREYERSRLRMMRSYAEHWECRRRFLLAYFGDEHASQQCGHCDCDTALDRQVASDAAHADFPAGVTVTHLKWGEGRVVESGEETITVDFAEVGEKKLSTELVREQNLLTLVAEPTGNAPIKAKRESELFQVGDPVVHRDYGEGEIQGINSERLTVLFARYGYHTLDRNLVLSQGLLQM
jgi:ATP-dependent DNA helicase RecQ